MKKVGFIGCGKIGRKIFDYIREKSIAEVVFILDPFLKDTTFEVPVVKKWESELCGKAELIIECATADVLKEHIRDILSVADLLPFSAAAFADAEFQEKAMSLCRERNRHIYLPHGAILGLDGLFDAKSILTDVSVETTKNPKSLGRNDLEYTVLYDGPAREACRLYPRNVNVHAEISLAGIGFDKTISRIISDPSVNTNTHRIKAEGEGVHFEIVVSSFATGGVTGAYTPLSACGSIERLLGDGAGIKFI